MLNTYVNDGSEAEPSLRKSVTIPSDDPTMQSRSPSAGLWSKQLSALLPATLLGKKLVVTSVNDALCAVPLFL